MNMLYADMFRGLEDRLTPVALIPMHDPDEAWQSSNSSSTSWVSKLSS